MPSKDNNYKTSFVEIPKRIDVKKRTSSEGVLPYDSDNLYPQRLEIYIQSSATAKACADLYCKHIYGEGFKNLDFGDKVINGDGHTMNELHRKVCSDIKLGGFAIHINYNVLLEAVEFQHIPFKFVRQPDDKNKENEGRLAVYDDWERFKSKQIRRSDIEWIDKFTTDPKEIEAQIAKATNAKGEVSGKFEDWKGHIFYYPDQYPLSPMDSAISDMETDAELALFRNSTVLTSFLASYAIVSKQDLEEDDEKAIDDQIRLVQGGRHAGKVIRIPGVGVDNEFTFQKLDTVTSDGLFEMTESSSQKNIRKSVLAPKELVGEEFNSGFNTEQIDQMRKYYNSVTMDEREELSRQYKKFVPLFIEMLNPTDDYEIQPLYEEELEVSEDGAVVEKDVQMLAMNGAQITSLQGLLTAAAMGEISKATAKAAIKAGFPNIPTSLVEEMINGLDDNVPNNIE